MLWTMFPSKPSPVKLWEFLEQTAPAKRSVFLSDTTGKEIESDLEKKSKIGYLSGNTKLYQRMSTRELLIMFGNLYGMDSVECKKRAEEIIEMLDMTAFADNRIEKLSTGQTHCALYYS